MRVVTYKDEKGFIWRRLVRDHDSDSRAPLGIPVGPPDLNQMDWEGMKKEMNNYLAEAGIFTWDDLQRHQPQFLGVVNIVKRHLILLYRDSEGVKVADGGKK